MSSTDPFPLPQAPGSAAAPWQPPPPLATAGDPLHPPSPQTGPPRPYSQLLRGAQHEWWRPLLSLSVVLGGLLVATGLLLAGLLVGVLLDPAVSAVDLASDTGEAVLSTTWWAFLAQNLFLALGIPLAGLAVWAGHQWRPRYVSSVAGGVRWRWLLTAALVALVLSSAFTALYFALDPAPFAPEEQAVLLLVVVLLTTPLQAAGEEYFFRGWMSQAVGSWFARPLPGALVGGAVSATFFAMAHGSQGPWLFADRFAFGVVASILVWRTGGLEASVAVHALNNMVIFVPTVLTGGLADALLVTDATWVQFAVDVAALSVLVVVLDRLARRRRLQRTQTAIVPPYPHAQARPGVAPGPVQSALGTRAPQGW